MSTVRLNISEQVVFCRVGRAKVGGIEQVLSVDSAAVAPCGIEAKIALERDS